VYRVEELGFRVSSHGLGFRVSSYGLGFRVFISWSRVQGFHLMV
jgi:hypothetical protein